MLLGDKTDRELQFCLFSLTMFHRYFIALVISLGIGESDVFYGAGHSVLACVIHQWKRASIGLGQRNNKSFCYNAARKVSSGFAQSEHAKDPRFISRLSNYAIFICCYAQKIVHLPLEKGNHRFYFTCASWMIRTSRQNLAAP